MKLTAPMAEPTVLDQTFRADAVGREYIERSILLNQVYAEMDEKITPDGHGGSRT